jgi:arylsulfatase A-like enzyme
MISPGSDASVVASFRSGAFAMFRVALALLCVAAGCGVSVAAENVNRPNVIVILADDMGYGDVGVHGCKDIPTPNIDSIAANGIRFSNGYVSHPYCSPTRAGLMTGRYQQRFGHEFNPGPATDRRPGIGLPLSETTIADRFRDEGYKTGIVGKWHLGHTDEVYHPLNRGFDEFFGFLGGSHSYLKSGTGHIAIFRNKEEIQEKEYLTDAFAREGVAFIERHKEEPFFLYWAFNAVHGPLEATDKYLDRFPDIKDKKRHTYAAMQSALDDAVGQCLATLRKNRLEENTLVFFLNDNGGPEAVTSADNGPLRGVKGTTWEGGIRVPFMVQWKGKLPAGTVYDHPVIALDVLPTALAAIGAEPSKSKKPLDGVNLLPFLKDEKQGLPHDILYWRFGGSMAIRKGDWKLVKTTGADGDRAVDRRGKASPDGAMLFNLKDDLGEDTDLAQKHPEKFKELADAWNQWNAELIDPLWGPPTRARARAGRP